MGQRFRVVITDYINDNLGPERDVLGDVADIEALNAFAEEDLEGRVEDADALVVYHHHPISDRTISRLRQCKLIARAGVGVDNIDLHAAQQYGVPVTNVPDYGTEEVADSAIGLTLALTRGIHLGNSRLRAKTGAWSHAQVAPTHRLRGNVFGIVGLGRIGTATALRAKACGLDIVFYDPYKPDGYDKALGIRRTDNLESLLAHAFVVSAHCNLTEETTGMIGADALARMPAGSFLINTARGAVVDTSAVLDALASGRLAGAGIDVLDKEPPDEENPLLRAWRDPSHPAHHRLILNPHCAFYCEEGIVEMRTKVAQECRRALIGEPLRNVVKR